MNIELLQKMISEKLVVVQKHPTADLFIYNYSARVQYEGIWNEVTLMTRGLILDGSMGIVALPFKKFFNLEEYDYSEVPKESFEVYEKMDGSLGILYWVGDIPYIATRGSFVSEQALHATSLLHSRYSHTFSLLDRESTYLFEIIYPANRIVVDYGGMDDIVLLSVVNNKTGDERIDDIGFPVVKRYDGINDLSELSKLEEDNKEGFVIRFKSGIRIKVKFSEYVRLHRIITQVSSVRVWEYLSEGRSFDELLDKVPDEFYDWVSGVVRDLRGRFDEILADCKGVFRDFETRKETALYFQSQKYPSVLFGMLDGKDVNKIIWKIVKPKHSTPFKNIEL